MNRNVLVSCLLVTVMLLASCSKKNDYEKVLPKDAAVVMSVDLVSMADKSGLSGDEGAPVVARLSNALKSGAEGAGELIDKVTKDPSESGLDLREKVYYFVGSGGVFTGLVMRVSDDGKLEDLLKALHDQQVCDMPKEADGCMWTAMGNVLVTYTDNAFLAMLDLKGGQAKDMLHAASMLLRQTEKDGFAATPDFQRMKETKGDIVLLSSLDWIPSEYVAPLTMGTSASMNLKDVKVLSAVNFEKGKVVMDVTDMTTDKLVNAMTEKQLQATNPVKGTYLDAFPANTFFWMTGNMDGGKVYDLLCENATIRQQFESSIMPIDFKAIFSSIKGDMAIALTNPLQNGFIAYADVTNSQFLQTFEDLKPLLAMTNGQMQLFNRGANDYEFRMQDGRMMSMRAGVVSFWFGVRNNRLYFTNDANMIDARVSGLSLRDCAWGKNVPGKRCYIGMNFASVADMAKQMLGANKQYASAAAALGCLDYMTIESTDYKSVHLELVTTNKDKNILQTILEAFK